MSIVTNYQCSLPADLPVCHFLRLPLGIRTKIYKLVLVALEPISLRGPSKARGQSRSRHQVADEYYREVPMTRSRLALVLTCRELYLEARHVYYGQNNFSFLSCEGRVVYPFDQAIGPVNRDAILAITFQTLHFPGVQHALKTFRNLKVFRFRVSLRPESRLRFFRKWPYDTSPRYGPFSRYTALLRLCKSSPSLEKVVILDGAVEKIGGFFGAPNVLVWKMSTVERAAYENGLNNALMQRK